MTADDRPGPTTGEAIGCFVISLVFGLGPFLLAFWVLMRGRW